MARTVYTYSIAADTGAAALHTATLGNAIVAAALGADLLECTQEETAGVPNDVLTIAMSAAITKSALDAVVTAHPGTRAVKHIHYSTAMVMIDEVAITDDATWQDLGAMVIVPSEFGTPANMHVHARLETKSVHGAGTPQLRIVDDSGAAVVELSTTPWHTIADGASWVIVAFQAVDAAPADSAAPHCLRLEGRLNSGTSASIRRASLTLAELD